MRKILNAIGVGVTARGAREAHDAWPVLFWSVVGLLALCGFAWLIFSDGERAKSFFAWVLLIGLAVVFLAAVVWAVRYLSGG